MAKCLDFSRLEVVTCIAISAFLADFGTSRIGCYNPCAKGMTEGGNVRVNVAVTAITGISSVALFGAGGWGEYEVIFVGVNKAYFYRMASN